MTSRLSRPPALLLALALTLAGIEYPTRSANAAEGGSESGGQQASAASEREMQELRQRVMELERQLKGLMRPSPVPAPVEAPAIAQPPPPAAAPAPAETPAVSMAVVKEAVTQVLSELPIKVGGSIKLRSDTVSVSDHTALLEDDTDSAARGQLRLWVLYNSPDSVVNGGFRVAAGETPNPAGSYARLGKAFQPEAVGFDQFYLGLRPFKNLEALGFAAQEMPLQLESIALTAGKMPQPFWRGSRGPYRSQMVWDHDISPVGATMKHTLCKGGPESWEMLLEHTVGGFVLEDTPDIDFNGITGETYLVADQLHFDAPHLGLGAAFYNYENLNAGLRSPTFDPGNGAFLAPGRNAILMRSGLQVTNNSVNYGTGADGFVKDHFRVLNVMGQTDWPLPLPRNEDGSLRALQFLGDPQFFVFADYAHNFAVNEDQDGYYAGAGIYGGGWQSGLHPWEIHFVWGDVDADATLATFASSDLGGGTDYKGWEVAWNYRLTRNLQLLMYYFDYDGAPDKDAYVRRLYVDVALEF